MNAKRLTELLGYKCEHEIVRYKFDKDSEWWECQSCKDIRATQIDFKKEAANTVRTFDTANDIAFAIGKLKEMGQFVYFTAVFLDGYKTMDIEDWLSLSCTEQAALIEEFLTTKEQDK